MRPRDPSADRSAMPCARAVFRTGRERSFLAHARRDRDRAGSVLLEVAIAAVVMSVTFLSFMQSVDQSNKRVIEANQHQIAGLLAENVKARYARAPLDDLQKALPSSASSEGPGAGSAVGGGVRGAGPEAPGAGSSSSAGGGGGGAATGGGVGESGVVISSRADAPGAASDAGSAPQGASARRILRNDPLLPDLQPYGPGTGAYEVSMSFDRDSERSGHFEVDVTYDTAEGRRTDELRTETFGRKPPKSAAQAARLAKSFPASPRALEGFIKTFEKDPENPLSKRALPVLELEARHGDLPEDLVGGLTAVKDESALLRLLEDSYARTFIPDGRYRSDWVELSQVPSPQGSVTDRFHILETLEGDLAGRLLVQTGATGDDRTAWVQGDPARHLGELPIAGAPGPGGTVSVEAGIKARVLVTRSRMYLFAPRLDGDGRALAGETEVTLVTLAPELSASAGAPDAQEVAVRLPALLELAGYRLPGFAEPGGPVESR